jgi:thiamine-phosphate pyrophosphorylase
LRRAARTLGRRRGQGKPGRRRPRLPALFFVTDPARVADPAAVAARLPRGTGVIYRAFGRGDALAVGRRLAAVARARGLVLLVGADEALAAAIGAHGLHLPERDLHRARRLRMRRPAWLVTGAAHGARGLARGRDLDAMLLSAVFPSRSPSAGRPLGPVRFAALVRTARAPVYALGGVRAGNAARLGPTGAAGLAAVDGLDEVGGRPQQAQQLEAGAGEHHQQPG